MVTISYKVLQRDNSFYVFCDKDDIRSLRILRLYGVMIGLTLVIVLIP